MKKIICFLVCVIGMVSCSKYFDKGIYDSDYEEALQKAKEIRDSITESMLPIKAWNVQTRVDEMDDTESHLAVLMSSNTIVQDFPYDKAKAIIAVRHTVKHGNNVLIRITSGQIYRSLYEGNYVEVRFDDCPSKKYMYSESASGSSDVIFIDRSKDFIENCKKHKTIKIKLPLYQEGEELFTFNTDSLLVWEY